MKADWKCIEKDGYPGEACCYWVRRKYTFPTGKEIFFIECYNAVISDEIGKGFEDATHYAKMEMPEPPEEPVKTVTFIEALRCVLDGGKAAHEAWCDMYMCSNGAHLMRVRLNVANATLIDIIPEAQQAKWIIIEEAPKKEDALSEMIKEIHKALPKSIAYKPSELALVTEYSSVCKAIKEILDKYKN